MQAYPVFPQLSGGDGLTWARETPAGAVDGVNAVFTLSQPPRGLSLFFVNGLLEAGDNVAADGPSLTLPLPPSPGDVLEVVYQY